MKQKTKNIIVLSALIFSFVSVAYAAYPISYWQITATQDPDDPNEEVLEFNYGDENIASNVMAVYPEGAVVVKTYAPSDGTAQGGQALELDIGGDMGAAYLCDEDGENCVAPDSVGVGALRIIANNAEWPGLSGSPYSEAPIDGDRVFNLNGRVVQIYDGNTTSWEPTYTENMQFYAYEFPLPNAEIGDVVWSIDGEAHCCYDGTYWELCDGGGRCSGAGGTEGSFTFDCTGNVTAGSDGGFKQGTNAEGYLNIPITSVSPGIVTLTVNENGFYAEREVILQGGETGISMYPLYFNGSGDAGSRTFSIASTQGTGSCTGEATIVGGQGSFDFYCPSNIVSPVDYIVGTASTGFINIQVTNATAGTATIFVDGAEFSAEEQVTLLGGETGIFLDIGYNGTGTAGVKNFSISSAQASGSCVGEATVTDTSANAFTCTSPGAAVDDFVVGTASKGGINLPITNAVAGAAVTLTISQDGFTKTHNVVLDGGDTAIFIPDVSYDGTGSDGAKSLTITSDQATNSCSASITVLPEGANSFTCTTAGAGSEDFILGTASKGGINLPITNAVGGETVVLEINQNGFTKTHITTLDAGQTAIFIPDVDYDGSGTAGSKTLTITSNQATNSCSANVTVTDEIGEFDFVCTANAVATGDFQFGQPGTGTMTIPIQATTDGTVTLNVAHNGFKATQNFEIVTGSQNLVIDLNYDGTSGPGTIEFGINSPHADSGCVGEAEVVPPDECASGTRVFSGLKPDSELYVQPAPLTNGQNTTNVDSRNYSDDTGPIILSGVTGNCNADLECVNGASQIVANSETCKDCPGGTMDGTAGAALVGVNATYTYNAFATGATQNVNDTVTAAEHNTEGVADMTCTATVTCDSADSVSLSNESCEIVCADGYAKNEMGVCVEANCDIDTIINGENSGWGYTVNAVIPVGNTRLFDGPGIRDNDNNCLNEYFLSVTCTAPDTWTWEENDPNCGGGCRGICCEDRFACLPQCGGNGCGGGGGFGGGGGNGGGGGGRILLCDSAFGPTAGPCKDDWQPTKTAAGQEWSPFGKFDNTVGGCEAGCDQAGDCKCQVDIPCEGQNGPGGRTANWGAPDELCRPCLMAGHNSRIDSRKSDVVYTFDDAMGYKTEYNLDKTENPGSTIACETTAKCVDGKAWATESRNETCWCLARTENGNAPYQVPEMEFNMGQAGLESQPVSILHGTATWIADWKCEDDGNFKKTSQETCGTVTCDDGFIEGTHCNCVEDQTSPSGGASSSTNATAFFDGPRIKNITDFLVQLFK